MGLLFEIFAPEVIIWTFVEFPLNEQLLGKTLVLLLTVVVAGVVADVQPCIKSRLVE